jgi:hypothetical protein
VLVVALAAWWLSIFWLWMLLVGEWNRTEWIAGALAATLTTLIAWLVWRVSGLRVRIPGKDIAAAWTLPAIILLDLAAVMAGFVTRRRGVYVTRAMRASGGSAPRRFGSRGWRAYVTTVPPNAYVVDLDEEQRTVLLHDLVPLRKSEEPIS